MGFRTGSLNMHTILYPLLTLLQLLRFLYASVLLPPGLPSRHRHGLVAGFVNQHEVIDILSSNIVEALGDCVNEFGQLGGGLAQLQSEWNAFLGDDVILLAPPITSCTGGCGTKACKMRAQVPSHPKVYHQSRGLLKGQMHSLYCKKCKLTHGISGKHYPCMFCIPR